MYLFARKMKWIRMIAMLLTIAVGINPLMAIPWLEGGVVHAADADKIVISKIFGGGSQNSSALYKNDFIELYNPTDSNVDVTGWSVQYADSNTTSDSTTWKVTPLTGTIPARGYFLIQEAGQAAPFGPDLPTPDATGTIDLNNKDGKVALLKNAAALTMANPTTPSLAANVVDFVGYGAAKSYYGTSAAPANSAQKGIVRKAVDPLNPSQTAGLTALTGTVADLYGHGWNSRDNGKDFDQAGTSGEIAPRNSSYRTPVVARADSVANKVSMSSVRTVNSSGNTFSIQMTTGTVKAGALGAGDYTVNGLPAGIAVTSAVTDAVYKITFTIGGTASADVTTDVGLSVVIKKTAITAGAYADSGEVSGITLAANNSPYVEPSPEDLDEANQIVISKLFGGGSQNDNAMYKYDFVELYNPTDINVNITGWSIQYAVSNATSDSNQWKATALTGTIPARGFFLVQEAGKATLIGPELPTPDAIGTIDLDNKDGKVALVKNSTPLTVLNPVKPSADANVVDFVGYGAAKSYNGSGATPAPSAQRAILRKAVNPLAANQTAGLSALTGSPGELYGHGWNKKDNESDFEAATLGFFSPHNAAYLTPLSVKIDSINNKVTMDTLRTISGSNNSFTVLMTTGKVKAGALAASDYSVSGLPNGLVVQSAIGDPAKKQIVFTLGGTAAADVSSDVTLSVTIKKSAIAAGAYDDSMAISGITLINSAPRVKGTVIANSLNMTAPNTPSGSFTVHLTAGAIKNGALADIDFSLTGLPNGITVQATGDAVNNYVVFTVAGNTAAPVIEPASLSLMLHVSAVTAGAQLGSDSLAGIILPRYNTPVDTSAARKAALIQRIKEDNSFFNDSEIKKFKYNQMSSSASSFYRGNPELNFYDLGSVIPIPQTWSSYSSFKTWISGDAHIQNVGYYDDKFGNIIFDLNDFDESYIAPFYFDLLRITSSIYLTRDDHGLNTGNSAISDTEMRQMTKTFLAQYMEALKSVIGNNNKNSAASKLNLSNLQDGFTKTIMTKLSQNTQLDLLNKSTKIVGSNRVFNIDGKSDKYRAATDSEKAEITVNWQTYLNSLSPAIKNAKLTENPRYYDIKDIAVRINQGLGSLGAMRYNVLLEGSTSGNNDDIILDVKEERKPGMFSNSYTTPSEPYGAYEGQEGMRAKTAYEKMSMDTDEHLGYLESSNRSFIVHKISPFKGDVADSSAGKFSNATELVDYLKYMAKVFAYAHARAATSADFEQNVMSQIYENSSVWNNFQTTLVNLSEDYYRQVAADYRLLKSDLTSGSLIDQDSPSMTLSGPNNIVSGSQLTVRVGLMNASDSVRAEDITVSYDSSLFEFKDVVQSNTNFSIADIKTDPGKIRVFLANTAPVPKTDVPLFDLVFKAKDVASAKTGQIGIDNAALGTFPTGAVVQAATTSLSVQVSKLTIPGDLNGDGVINVGDLAIAAGYFGAKAGDTNWNEATIADITGSNGTPDGKVDIWDLRDIAQKISSQP
ncbi:Uncharacterized conserved protein, DUF2252 family [Paenibacillus sp. 1_12]|uniref:DUF2252 family protein n=1 Tax=Paenibacillus sp. 1_12 TaxID=1566278 RepID=UPI0008E38139|nr:DUF2252 family protein [Paenibacillus sp. 1_12]SFM39220.1 Uncharacterized conserved protein, DUF2252 family [Paenibacillus sp. 1_12]